MTTTIAAHAVTVTAVDHAIEEVRTGFVPQTVVGTEVGIQTGSTAPAETTPGIGVEPVAKALLNHPLIDVMTLEHATSPSPAAQQSKKTSQLSLHQPNRKQRRRKRLNDYESFKR